MTIHSRSRRLAIGTVLAVACFGATANGQTVRLGASIPVATEDPSTQPVVGTGLIAGQVVDASSGRPIADVMVTLGGTANSPVLIAAGLAPANTGAQSATGAPRQVLTDAQGQFVFHSLNKGRQQIRATAAGYVTGGPGQHRPNGPTQDIDLSADDSKVGGVVVRMWKHAVIAGTVVDETGEAIIGAMLTALRKTTVNGQPRLSMSGIATTDDRGAYRIAGLTPGDYLVMTASTQTTMPVSVFDAYSQAASSGTSLANNDVYRELISSGGPMPMGIGGQRVGDLILQSGTGGRAGLMAPAPVDETRFSVYPTQVYPSATVTSQGTVIALASGETKTGIDMQLKLMPSFRISGTVTGPDGPARNLGVKLYASGAESITGAVQNPDAASTATDANGVFTFLGIVPGDYTLKILRVPRPAAAAQPSNVTEIQVSGPGMSIIGMTTAGAMPSLPPPIPTDPTLWASLPVSVDRSDVSGLNISLRSGARVTGKVQFEGTKPAPPPEVQQRIALSFQPLMDVRAAGGPTAVRVDAQGGFATGGYSPGRYTMNGNVPPVPGSPPGTNTGWTLKSVVLSGRNLLDDPLQIDSEDISGVVVTFTDRTSQAGGVVRDSRGLPDAAAEIVIFPADSDGWKLGLPSRRIRGARTSPTGTYEFAALPAGDYYVTALAPDSIGDWQDPKFLEKLIPAAVKVTVSEGARRAQDLVTKTVK